MAKNLEFYKGSRKKRNYWLIPFVIGLGLITLLVVLFYGMQKYAVISKDGVEVVLPGMKREVATTVDSEGHTVRVFDEVPTTLVFDAPDYSRIQATAGKNLQSVRAIYIAAEDINEDNLMEKAGRLNDGNALMLEMKPRSGQTLWESHTHMAEAYSLTMQNDITAAMPEMIQMLKEKDIYLVAEISCCIDELLPTRTTAYCIHTETGLNFTDGLGTWLDPYSLDLRVWIAEMVRELWDLGFDEVVLKDVAHPSLAEAIPLLYSREISTPRSSAAAVCGLAAGVADRLYDRQDKAVSIWCNTREALVRDDLTTGQNAVLFMSMYDRVYLDTDKYSYPYNVEDIESQVTVGSVYDRLVPVVINYIPDNTSWILVDGPED